MADLNELRQQIEDYDHRTEDLRKLRVIAGQYDRQPTAAVTVHFTDLVSLTLPQRFYDRLGEWLADQIELETAGLAIQRNGLRTICSARRRVRGTPWRCMHDRQ